MEYTIFAISFLLGTALYTLSNYDLQVCLTDAFYIKQMVSIGAKQVFVDFYNSDNSVLFRNVAENLKFVEFGWLISFAEPLDMDQDSTGDATDEKACAMLEAIKQARDSISGNLYFSGYLYPSLLLAQTYDSSTNCVVSKVPYLCEAFLPSQKTMQASAAKMLEVRHAGYKGSLDDSVVFRHVMNGIYFTHHILYAGMPIPVPIASSGMWSFNASSDRLNIVMNNTSNIAAGMVSAAKLPFKSDYDSTTIRSSTAIINNSSIHLSSVPKMIVTSATMNSNWSDNNVAIKMYNKTTTQANVIVGGNYFSNHSRG